MLPATLPICNPVQQPPACVCAKECQRYRAKGEGLKMRLRWPVTAIRAKMPPTHVNSLSSLRTSPCILHVLTPFRCPQLGFLWNTTTDNNCSFDAVTYGLLSCSEEQRDVRVMGFTF